MFQVALFPRTLAACKTDLEHRDPQVRLSVLKDLVKGEKPEERGARIALLAQALSDSHADVRRQALVALADFGAHEAIEDVLVLLRDVEIGVRQMAVLCLGELAEPEDDVVIGRIASLLRAGDPSLRYQALLAHAQLRPEEAADDLLQGLRDVDAEIRELAIRLVDEVLLARDICVPPALEEAIRGALTDDNAHVRLQAELFFAAQGAHGPYEGISRVVSRQLRPKEPRDEQMSIVYSGRLGLVAAKGGLERRAYGRFLASLDPFRFHALGALGRMGEEKALEKLRTILRTGSAIERNSAVQALAETAHPEALAQLEALVGQSGRVDQEFLLETLQKARGGVLAPE